MCCGRIVKLDKSGIEMLLVGGLTAAVVYAVGALLKGLGG
jgi:VIT1/CCC1 family predicted Fe2+/Mn2+ transporter